MGVGVPRGLPSCGHGRYVWQFPYLCCREEGHSKLQQACDLDLHGGQRALEGGQRLGGETTASRENPFPSKSHSYKEACPPVATPPSGKYIGETGCTHCKGLLELWIQGTGIRNWIPLVLEHWTLTHRRKLFPSIQISSHSANPITMVGLCSSPHLSGFL